jgi:sphingomyelin phosphodiesterase
LADLHIDLEYKVGANSNCNTVICCRESSGNVTSPEYAAAQWGEYSCDLPYQTLDLMGQHIVREIKPDIIFYTGDIVPHDQWDLTIEEVEGN